MNMRNKSFRDLIRDGVQNRVPGAGFTISNATGPKATIRLYDVIGWPFILAEDVARELDSVTADEIEVQISSPGGDVFEGVAIYNALRAHPAQVTTRVDSMAASIASVIAQAGDRRVMLSGSQMMIHEAWGITIGPSEDHRKQADVLDKQSDIIAGIYAERSGSDVDFRGLMSDESWFDAAETVEHGLADEVVKPSGENHVPSKFAADAAALVGAVEAFVEEAENVVAFRSSQGKPPLSDDASEQVEKAKAALARLDAVASDERTETTNLTRLEAELLSRRYK